MIDDPVYLGGGGAIKLCFIADARSPIAEGWIRHFVAAGHEVHVVSTHPCALNTIPGAASLHVVPVAFSWLKRGAVSGGDRAAGWAPSQFSRALSLLWSGAAAPFLGDLRYRLAPLDVGRHVGKIRMIVAHVRPQLVHALRIPFEGILAAEALADVNVPLLLSVWGNDLTLFASRYPAIGRMTRRALARATALFADCQRDLRLAREWGFPEGRPDLVAPGSGGIRMAVFRPRRLGPEYRAKWGITGKGPVVFYPRRFRPGSVRTDTFFASVPKILRQRPDTVFLCVGMAGNHVAEEWRKRLPEANSVVLLPSVTREEMSELFQISIVTVSPSEHDGTPNTLLEGMACGAFPVAGDIESVREWIEDGRNGFLCDPSDPEALAGAVLRALTDDELRRDASRINREIIAGKAEYGKVMASIETFYRGLI